MNYNLLLDEFFGNKEIAYGAVLLYFGIILFLKKRLFPNPDRWFARAVFVYAIPTIGIMTISTFNPGYLGYGKPDGIEKVWAIDGKLYVMDNQRTPGGRSYSPSYGFRMHIIDPATGAKKLRFRIRSAYGGEIVFVSGDTIAFANSDKATFFSGTTGSIINTWSAQTLPKLFPELASGVKDLEYRKTLNRMDVSSLNGNKWIMNLRGNSISPYKEEWETKYQPTNKTQVVKGEIKIDNDQIYPTVLMSVGTVRGSDNKGVLCRHDTIVNRHITFLHGEIVARSLKDNCFVVRDYDNINMIGVDYTCMSLDGQRKLWELRESVLRPGDRKDESVPESSCLDEQNGVFIAALDNELFAVRVSDGNMLWRQVP